MDRVEQFDFLKNYYELLKSKDAHNIGGRFLTQAKQLAAAGEIDKKVLKIITASIEIGEEMGRDLNQDDFEVIKDFINIGVEIKEEQGANKLANTIANFGNTRTVDTDPCSRGYSGKSKSGC